MTRPPMRGRPPPAFIPPAFRPAAFIPAAFIPAAFIPAAFIPAAFMLALLLLLAAPALAQAPIVATPLPPVDAQTSPPEPSPQLPRAPGFAEVWLPRPGAVIQALDKVNARSATLTVPVGQTTTYQSLSIAVRSCVVRPPDQPADAAVFVTVTDKADPARSVGLWLVRSAPAVSILQHAIFDLRVMGCTS